MNPSMKKTTLALAITLIAAPFATTALAQKPDAGGAAVVASEPGKVVVAGTVEVSAKVVAINKGTRTLTLKGPSGDVVDLAASTDVKNFDQIKVGDFVVARYARALTLELRKTKGNAGDVTVSEGAATAKPGERPAAGGAREVTAIATVTAVDPKKKTISLKGPNGKVVMLDVKNPDQFKVVKKGDQVQVTYTEALVLSVEPAAKPAKAK